MLADPQHVFSAEVSAQLKRIELTTSGLVESLFSGEYHSIFKGRGLEFSDVREYQPGDDVRSIDWNVTARRGRLFVKEFVEERQLNALVIVDLSASKTFGTGVKQNSIVAAEISDPGTLTAAISGLSGGRNYVFEVSATNALGEGVRSTPSTTISTSPAAPTP